VSQVQTRFEAAGVRIAEIVTDLVIIAEDGRVSPEEFPLLMAAIEELAEQGLVVEDAGYDVQLAIQTLRLGRALAPDGRHLRPKIASFEAHRRRREQKKAAARSELAAAAGQ
jgi:hypothetical protein